MFFEPVQAQRTDGETEVLAFIMPDALEIPDSIKGQIPVEKAMIKDVLFRTALSGLGIISIGKAFPDWDKKDSIGISKSGERVRKPDFHRVFTLRFTNEKQADIAIESLKKLPDILYAEKNKNNESMLDNDPRYLDGSQWYLRNTGQNGGVAGADINAEEAWSMFTGSSNRSIAIFDTGVDQNHEEFQARITGDGPDGGAHGTMVAGVAGATGNNSIGIRGLDWRALIISQRIHATDGYMGDAHTAQKIMDAAGFGADVMNHSWSWPETSTTLASAFAYAYKMNMVAVATMGNTGITETRFPGAFDNVITVGATTNRGVVSGFSTRGNHIDVVAPGGIHPQDQLNAEDIFTTQPGNQYGLTSGTSFAAPQVSGLASLLKGYRSFLANDDITNIIRLSARDIDDPGFDIRTGFGQINAGAALHLLQQPYTVNQWTANGGTSVSTSGSFEMTFLGTEKFSGTRTVKRHEVTKTITFPQSFCHIVGVWGRGVGTTGWNQANPNYGVGFTEVVPGTLTSTGVTLRTYVYEILTSGQFVGYSPASPANVVFAYTVLGIPGTPASPTISANPASINSGGSSTLTAAGCAGTLTWSTGQTGNSISVSPAQTTAYTVSCSQFSCPNTTSAAVSVSVTTNPTDCNYTNGQVIGTSPGGTNVMVSIESGCKVARWQNAHGNGRVNADWIAQLTGKTVPDNVLRTCVKWDGDPLDCQQNPCNFNVTAGNTNANPSTNQSLQLSYNCSGAECSGVSYAWGGNGISGGSSPLNITAPGSSGYYTYTVTASKSGCSNKTATTSITVGNNQQPCNCGFDLISASQTSGQYTASFQFNSCSVYQVQWSILLGSTVVASGTENVTSSTVPFTVPATVNSGSYTLKVDVINCSGTDTEPFSYTKPGTTGDCNYTNGQVIGTSSGGTNVVVSIESGCKVARWQNANGNGRVHPDWIPLLTGKTVPDNVLRTCVKWDGDPINCGGRMSAEPKTGAASPETGNEALLTVSPNPSNGAFDVSFRLEKGQKATLMLLDAKGAALRQRQLTGTGDHKEHVTTDGVSSGSYLVVLRRATGQETKRVVLIK